MAPPLPIPDPSPEKKRFVFASKEYCKISISLLIKHIVRLYNVILEFFRANAENEVRVALSELPQKYDRLDEKRDDGFTPYMSDLIKEAQTWLSLDDLKNVRAEMKIWKKLWKKWGLDATFIPWDPPHFLPSVDPETWPEPEVVEMEEKDNRCLRCGLYVEDKELYCKSCGALNVQAKICFVIIDGLIDRICLLYTFITSHNIRITADTYRFRCIDRDHPFHGTRGQCTLGTWAAPFWVRKYIESYPRGFPSLDAIPDPTLRKDIINEILSHFPNLRFELFQLIHTPEIIGTDFAELLAITKSSSDKFQELRVAIMDGDPEKVYGEVESLYRDFSSYRDIENAMKLEMKYLSNRGENAMLPLTLAVAAPGSASKNDIIDYLIRGGGRHERTRRPQLQPDASDGGGYVARPRTPDSRNNRNDPRGASKGGAPKFDRLGRKRQDRQHGI